MSTCQTPKSAQLCCIRWSWWSQAHIVCVCWHSSAKSRRCNGLSADFRVWHENVINQLMPCSLFSDWPISWEFCDFIEWEQNSLLRLALSTEVGQYVYCLTSCQLYIIILYFSNNSCFNIPMFLRFCKIVNFPAYFWILL